MKRQLFFTIISTLFCLGTSLGSIHVLDEEYVASSVQLPLHGAVCASDTERIEKALADGHDIDERDAFGNPALILAAKKGCPECVRLLLCKGASMWSVNRKGRSLLYYLIKKIDFPAIDLLFSLEGLLNSETKKSVLDALANKVTHDGWEGSWESVAFICAEKGYVALFGYLLQNGFKGCKNVLSQTCLDIAARNGRGDIVGLFFQPEVVEQKKDNNCNIGIHLATKFGLVNIVQVLINKDPLLINALDDKGKTPLIIAAEVENEVLALKFIAEGAEVDIVDRQGDSALHYGVRRKRPVLVKALLGKGRDGFEENKNGESPLVLAFELGDGEIIRLFQERAYNKMKLSEREAGRLPTKGKGEQALKSKMIRNEQMLWIQKFMAIEEMRSNANLKAFLMAASKFAYVDIVRVLIWYGADVNGEMKGELPLMTASRCGNDKVVDFLLSKAARVDALCSGRKTALLGASRCGHAGIMKKLIEAGADINLTDEAKETPISCALASGNVEAVKLLLKSGASMESVEKTTLLHMAVISQEPIEILRMLLHEFKALIDMNAVNVRGETAFLLAVRASHYQAVGMLLEYGCDPFQGFSSPESLLDEVVSWGDRYWFSDGREKTCLRIVKMCMEKKKNCSERCRRHMLSLAVNWDSLELLNLLIEWGVTIEMVNKDELFNGILSGHRPHKTVQRLIELKLDISSPNLYGRTLLHVAAQVGDEGFVEMLCQAGVPLNFFWGSNPPSTPLTVAAIYGHERVVDLLIKYGATVDVDERFIKEHSEAIKLKLQRARRNQQLRRGLTYASPLVVVLAYLTAHWLI